ncbi:MAG: glycosyl transferase family 1, partial [Candidatus Fischerbacteria bacterium RBG_13_37_8]
MANHFDEQVIASFAKKSIKIPIESIDYINLNEYVTLWLEKHYDKIFNEESQPDIVVIAGWPFFPSIPFFRKKGCKVVFSDHGIVPLDGYTGGQLETLKKLMLLKKEYVRFSSAIIGVSNFIIDSQSKPYSRGAVPLFTVLNPANHMELKIWNSSTIESINANRNGIETVRKLKTQQKKILLHLGRWETNCYKNSQTFFDIIRTIKNSKQDCALLILAEEDQVLIPEDLKNNIYPIGYISDNELIDIYHEVDLGISVSLWEGFNLPLAEMQWLNKPVLAFNIGAHPEVIVHPWFLCNDEAEMSSKALSILNEKGPDAITIKKASEKFHNYFTVDRFVNEYTGIFEKLSLMDTDYFFIIDVTNATKDPANTGVIRVTRRFSKQLQKYANPIFVIWDDTINSYVLPTRAEYNQLGQYNGPQVMHSEFISSETDRIPLSHLLPLLRYKKKWLLFTETIFEENGAKIRDFAKNNNMQVAAIFYDAIPVLYPNFCKEAKIRENHSNYMKGLAECDVVIPISNFSADCLKDFWSKNSIAGAELMVNQTPGECGDSARIAELQPTGYEEIKIFCVSTLEPRKNHVRMIEALLKIKKNHPELQWTLTLVGNRSAGALNIADEIQEISNQHPQIKWLGVVDDQKLVNLYREATFTIYPSIIEGFGIPILESMWHGKPCICHREGVMSEIARDGGCLVTNVLDVNEFAETIYQLATKNELLIKLSDEAINRKIKNWDEYVRD